jgi:hypothetical protein
VFWSVNVFKNSWFAVFVWQQLMFVMWRLVVVAISGVFLVTSDICPQTLAFSKYYIWPLTLAGWFYSVSIYHNIPSIVCSALRVSVIM